jgi:N-acetylglucosaminyl-diphospho-decaprenol L-rhamnosyltransferase
MGEVSVVVATYNSADHVERCLEGVVGHGYEVVVVDNASEDGTVERVRRAFPEVEVVELEENVGYGAANNVGIDATSGRYVLVVNPDAWPLGRAIERMVEAADVSPWAAIVGPRLLTATGKHQRSFRGFPTVWRLATEYFFLRWLAPGSRLLNAFYGAGADPRKRGEVEWVVGAAMLLRREAIEEAERFDPSFFMYDEEVDLAYRLRQLGWEVLYYPHAEFVHLGGGSTRRRPREMYHEQLRSHVRFLDKHHGRAAAEHGRRMLLRAMRLRSAVLLGERGRISADAATWLASHDVEALLSGPPRLPRTPRRRSAADRDVRPGTASARRGTPPPSRPA